MYQAWDAPRVGVVDRQHAAQVGREERRESRREPCLAEPVDRRGRVAGVTTR